MKRCPECGRDYNDDSLSFCLDDGSELLFGPAVMDEPATAILSDRPVSAGGQFGSESATRPQIHTRAADAESRGKVGSRRRQLGVVGIAALLLVGSFFGYRYFSSGNSKQIESIAVMPFVNESGNADVEYLSDGMAETLINSLSKLGNLSVKARNAVFPYKGKEVSAKQIGEELGVQAVLLGRLAERGGNIKLNLELVNAKTLDVIWSEQYDRKQGDLVNLQQEITRDVLTKLKTKLSGAEEQKLARTYTTDPEAYRLYLQGRFNWNKREERYFRNAAEYYNRAVALDPNFALAFAGLADTYALLSSFNFMPATEAVPRAREYTQRTLVLDASLAEPHATLGYVLSQYEYDIVGAEAELKRAIELDPNYATAHQWFGEVLTYSGRFDESFTEFRHALEIEPLSLPINWGYGRALYMGRRYDESLAQLKKTVEIDPSFARTHRSLAELYRVRGDYASAAEERAKFFDLIGQAEAAALVRSTFAGRGWPALMRLIVTNEPLLKDSNNEWVIAKAYLDLGEKEKAIDQMNKAYEKRLSSVCWFKTDPQLDPIRDDPRYIALIKKLQF